MVTDYQSHEAMCQLTFVSSRYLPGFCTMVATLLVGGRQGSRRRPAFPSASRVLPSSSGEEDTEQEVHHV